MKTILAAIFVLAIFVLAMAVPAMALECPDSSFSMLFDNGDNEFGFTYQCTLDDGSEITSFGFQLPADKKTKVIIQSLIEAGTLKSMVEALIDGRCYRHSNTWQCIGADTAQ